VSDERPTVAGAPPPVRSVTTASPAPRDGAAAMSDLVAGETRAGATAAPAAGYLVPPVDLHTLLSEMAALRTEVRAETLASREMRDRLSEGQELHEEALAQAALREAELREEGEAGRERGLRRAALALGDIYDRLLTTERSARALLDRGRWWWPFSGRAMRAARALLDGVELSRAAVARDLEDLGACVVEATGKAFDPEVMEAVSVVEAPEGEDGLVVEQVSVGLTGPGGNIRPARVIVQRCREQGLGQE
jgi:molecular chaperone GrpE